MFVDGHLQFFCVQSKIGPKLLVVSILLSLSKCPKDDRVIDCFWRFLLSQSVLLFCKVPSRLSERSDPFLKVAVEDCRRC